MTDHVFSDKNITITKDFIHQVNGEREVIRIDSISQIEVSRIIAGDYKAGAILFFILGILSIWFLVGFVFLALGIAAWNTKIYLYSLTVTTNGTKIYLFEKWKSHSYLKGIARTLQGLTLSNKVLNLEPQQKV